MIASAKATRTVSSRVRTILDSIQGPALTRAIANATLEELLEAQTHKSKSSKAQKWKDIADRIEALRYSLPPQSTPHAEALQRLEALREIHIKVPVAYLGRPGLYLGRQDDTCGWVSFSNSLEPCDLTKIEIVKIGDQVRLQAGTPIGEKLTASATDIWEICGIRGSRVQVSYKGLGEPTQVSWESVDGLVTERIEFRQLSIEGRIDDVSAMPTITIPGEDIRLDPASSAYPDGTDEDTGTANHQAPASADCLAEVGGEGFDSAGQRGSLPTPEVDRLSTLEELAVAINLEHELCQQSYQSAIARARACGEFLNQAKASIKSSPDGRWLPWLSENCPALSDRTAQTYMKIAENWEQILKKTQHAADFLSIREALNSLKERKVSEGRERETLGSREQALDVEWQEVEWRPKERDRVIIASDHPLYPGMGGKITGLPGSGAAIVQLDDALDSGRERIELEFLCPERFEEVKAESVHQSTASPAVNAAPSPSVVKVKPVEEDEVATEIAVGLRHLSPEQIAWTVTAAADAGLSDECLKAIIRSAKRSLNGRHHPDYDGVD